MNPVYRIKLRWLTPQESGRQSPIRGGRRYTPTARFAGEESQFSVVLEFPQSNLLNPPEGTLRLLFSDLVEIQRRMVPGVALEIMEGARVVANCRIESLEPQPVAAAAR